MIRRVLTGDQALAYGALVSGISMVTAYPGSPGTGTVETLIQLAKEHDFYVEWSANEKVALEMGIGASIAGNRTLVCTKSVGMNVMIDPLMVLNLTPLNGGLVILLGDDPGAYGSQNDQDSRPIAAFVEMPLMEPASPAEAFDMVQEAFRMSESLGTPVIIRETRSFSQQEEMLEIPWKTYERKSKEMIREPFRYVPVPVNAVSKHRELHQRLEKIVEWADQQPFNNIRGEGKLGVVAGGFAYRKLMDVLNGRWPEECRLLKLGNLFPLPRNSIHRFLENIEQVLVLEENEPFIERQLKAIVHDLDLSVKILGKEDGLVHREGELYRWQIQESLQTFLGDYQLNPLYSRALEQQERPPRKNHCAGSNYELVLNALKSAADQLGRQPVLVGDPGCLAPLAERLDAKYAMGSAIGVADGLCKAGISETAIALLGDSSFFHTSLPALCNAVYNQSKILIIVLDNQGAVTTGVQPHPGVGRDAWGRETQKLDIAGISRACGVKKVHVITDKYPESALQQLFEQVLRKPALEMIVVEMKGKNKKTGIPLT